MLVWCPENEMEDPIRYTKIFGTTQIMIVHACMALCNFIRDSALADKEFDKCDADENYILNVVLHLKEEMMRQMVLG